MDIALKVLIGFVVGTLIGMTGVGGGVLLLPVLIFGLRVPPIIAVGSDALFNFFTKIGSGMDAPQPWDRAPASCACARSWEAFPVRLLA